MHETLSVIDEHMNDMNTPPGSFNNSKRSSSGMKYSYIAGQETDEEENGLHTEEEVLEWSSERVAEYLEDHGVERSHCDVFRDQEISGEVLLAMEQSSLFLKEFALGSVGRRLKTWHKIRALQDEVRQSRGLEAAKSTLDDVDEEEEQDAVAGDTGRARASTLGSVLPRALDTSRQSTTGSSSNEAVQPFGSATSANLVSPLISETKPEDRWKVSQPREEQGSKQQSRRHSSISPNPASGSFDATTREGHRKQPSMDDTWRPGQPQANGNGAIHQSSFSADSIRPLPQRNSSLHAPIAQSTPYEELDGEYDLANEADRSSMSQQLKKNQPSLESTDISRTNSSKRRSTLGSSFLSSDILRDGFSPSISQGIFGALNSVGSSLRSATSPQTRRKPVNNLRDSTSPIVTKLEYSASTDALTTSSNASAAAQTAAYRSSTSPKLPFFSSQKPKVTGLRTTSDAVTKTERLSASPVRLSASPVKEPSPARTGSTTPSTETQSLEFQKSDAQMRASLGAAANLSGPPAMTQRRVRVKPKKATSAYTRGLEKKTPAEQIAVADYSGWMKKKSGSLMTTWKTRLFVLRGRRLSYYYADDDTEEKGLIDISFHRVLPAHNETLTGLHAAVTGAAGTPTSPRDSQTQTAAQQDLKEKPALAESDDGMFIFKLVPPKSGLPKGVNFTKPTVHYFAVNSRQEGRLWMAALMKATIDRDEDGKVTTTYNQKTISLAKAQARRERPPALKDITDLEEPAELHGDDGSGTGLGIGGLEPGSDAVGGASDDRTPDDSSIAPSTVAPSTAATGLDSLHEKDTEIVNKRQSLPG